MSSFSSFPHALSSLFAPLSFYSYIRGGVNQLERAWKTEDRCLCGHLLSSSRFPPTYQKQVPSYLPAAAGSLLPTSSRFSATSQQQ
eukprot:768101-Hanusia_phi.AAC.6